VAEPIWVGVDLGTQSVRAVAVGATGTLLSAAARPLRSGRDGVHCDLLGAQVGLPASAEAAVGMAVPAAGAVEGDVPAAAARMVRTRATLDPDPRRGADLMAGYLDVVTALTDRGWLDPRTAAHARRRAAP
jgi:D-ribulokinase